MGSTTIGQDKTDAAMRNIIVEARVIRPGPQAWFGIQTIAVFSDELRTSPLMPRLAT